jgi:hydrogenase/urease accessory protein HupE
MRTRVPGAGALALLTALLIPVRADAHLVTTGLGPVYDGIGHLLLTPEDLVPILALALYAGLRGARAGRLALFVLPVAWLAGGLIGLRLGGGGGAAAAPLPALSFILLGLLVAADAKLPDGAVAALAAALGLAHGFWNGPALAGTGPGALGLLGIAAVAFVMVALAAALVVSLKAPAARIAVRVAGSWIAAIGLLLLGWAFRTRAVPPGPGMLAP